VLLQLQVPFLFLQKPVKKSQNQTWSKCTHGMLVCFFGLLFLSTPVRTNAFNQIMSGFSFSWQPMLRFLRQCLAFKHFAY